MPIYNWEGRTLKGLFKKGKIEAPGEVAIRIHLRQQSIVPTQILAKGKEITICVALPEKSEATIGRCFYTAIGNHD